MTAAHSTRVKSRLSNWYNRLACTAARVHAGVATSSDRASTHLQQGVAYRVRERAAQCWYRESSNLFQ